LHQDTAWQALALEPNLSSDKVDIIWEYSTKKKVSQVKSSQNQIGKAQAESWAKELETSILVDDYELVLIGPCSQSVIELGSVGKVKIPTPKNLDVTGLVEQAAHRLDVYLGNKGISKVPSFARELLISSLVIKLETYSTAGTLITRDDFDRLLSEWILALYPQSINEAVEMQCDILVDTVIFAVTTAPSHNSPAIILPITFINHGVRTAIIEWVAIKIISEKSTKIYTPIALIDYEKFLQGKRALHAENVKSHFSEFALGTGLEKELHILFSQEESHSTFPFSLWETANHKFEIYVKYRDKDTPTLQRSLDVEVTNKLLQDYANGVSAVCSFREIKF
jgi:hypothetical protein